MKHVAAFFLFFVPLWWLWQLLSGEWSHYEWIAGAGAAAIGALLAEIVRARARGNGAVPAAILRSAPSALGMVLVDFALVLRAIVTRTEGVFLTNETSETRPERRRAWAEYVATISPNAYVIEIDPETGRALTHHLVPFQKSQDPV